MALLRSWIAPFAAAALVVAAGGAAAHAPAERVDRLDRVTRLSGAHPAWDYLTFDASRSRLFVGRRAAGITVYDEKARKLVGHIARTEGANIATFVPEVGRGYTANDVDANIVIYDQVAPDCYEQFQAVMTRPIARTLAIDPATERLYTVTAEGMVDPDKPVNRKAAALYPNVYFDNTFVLLEYGLHPKPKAPKDED